MTMADDRQVRFSSEQGTLDVAVALGRTTPKRAAPGAETVFASSARWWSSFWERGAVVSFDGSTNPRGGARAAGRAVAVPDGGQLRRLHASAGVRSGLQHLVRLVPPRDALAARRAFPDVGEGRSPRAQHRLVTPPYLVRTDHPSMLMAYGWLPPGALIENSVMEATLDSVWRN